MMAVVISVGHK